MAAAAAGGAGEVFRGVFEGSISGSHLEVDRRPYHKNCTCPLHGLRAPKCPHHKNVKVSYPIRRSWSEGSLALYAASSSSSPSSSPTLSPSFKHHRPKQPPLPPPPPLVNLCIPDFNHDHDHDDVVLN